MNEIAALFYEIGEPYAAGLFEEPEKSYFYRLAMAHARFFEALKPAAYDEGELIYPCEKKFFNSGCAVQPCFCRTYQIDWDKLGAKSERAAKIMEEFYAVSHITGGWTHFAPNYKRIVKEGLASYRRRILRQPQGEFYEGLLAILDAMEGYIRRSIDYLKSVNAPAELIAAMEKVPFQPADTYYEGLVSWNLIFYFDNCDNLGCLSDGLAHLYRGEDYTHIIGQLFNNIDKVGNWSCTVGPDYNPIVYQAVRAIKNRRRPMLELMVDDNMPDDLWELAVEQNRAGSANPSFYSAKNIYKMLKDHFPHIPDEEIRLFCGCGCTETNLQGLTRSGGTDEDLPLAEHFEKYLHAHLAKMDTFEEFYEGFCQKVEAEADAILDRIIAGYEYMAKYLPNPMRTLFTDDCIEKGKDFNAGGARYTWTQSSDSGLINTIDSLLAVRELVYRRKMFTADQFLEKLTNEDPMFYAILRKCPCFGVDNEEADALATDFTTRVYSVYRNRKPGNFIDACLLTEHQFLRYESIGRKIGPTPDGRHAGDPTCDSIAAIRGKATQGPTAMLRSASKLPQHLADGISVLNLTINKNFVGKPLRALIEGYFDMGGIQVQVTCVSADELKDAYEHPENHRDLIVRVGGYTDYFINLTPALRKAVLERNIHELG